MKYGDGEGEGEEEDEEVVDMATDGRMLRCL